MTAQEAAQNSGATVLKPADGMVSMRLYEMLVARSGSQRRQSQVTLQRAGTSHLRDSNGSLRARQGSVPGHLWPGYKTVSHCLEDRPLTHTSHNLWHTQGKTQCVLKRSHQGWDRQSH